MAIKDTTRNPYVVDNDTDVNVGLDLPIRRAIKGGSGFFATTSTTIEAVKNNIRNLLQTNQGERFMQPLLGTNLRKNLFEPSSEDTRVSIQNNIVSTFEFWLPFVEIRNLQVNIDENNFIRVNIDFNIVQDPDTLESVQLDLLPPDEMSTESTIY
tara:strand:+ start:446 stop:910 length:465 start_codon:yes stop_codon:yes gene_type:complete